MHQFHTGKRVIIILSKRILLITFLVVIIHNLVKVTEKIELKSTVEKSPSKINNPIKYTKIELTEDVEQLSNEIKHAGASTKKASLVNEKKNCTVVHSDLLGNFSIQDAPPNMNATDHKTNFLAPFLDNLKFGL